MSNRIMKTEFYVPASRTAKLFVVCWCFFIIGCQDPNPSLVVKNVGFDTLQSVTVYMRSYQYDLGDIAPGDSSTAQLDVTEESGIAVSHQSLSRTDLDVYVTSGVRGTISVQISSDSVRSVNQDLHVGLFDE